MVSSMDALSRRMRDSLKPTYTDSRSTSGRLSRGDNVYNGGTSSSGSNQWGGSATAINSGGSGSRSMQPVDNGNLGAINMQPVTSTPTSGGGGGSFTPTQPETNPMDEFDAIYEKRLNDIMAQQAQINSRREQALRSLDQQKAFSQDALKRMFDRNLDRNEINMADRGLYRSGINIREQGDIGEDYQNDAAQNLAQFASQREGIEQQYGNLNSQFQDLLSQVQQERALRAEEIARQRAERDAENQALQPVLQPDGRYTAPNQTGISYDVAPTPTRTMYRSERNRVTPYDPIQEQQTDFYEALKRRLGR